MNFSALYGSTQLSKTPKTAGLWTPKSTSSWRVGTDYMKHTVNKGYKDGENTLKLGDSVEIANRMQDAFSLGRQRAMNGFAAGSFRGVTEQDLTDMKARQNGEEAFVDPHEVFKSGNGTVRMGQDAQGRYLLVQGSQDAEARRVSVDADARIRFQDGHAVVETGSALGNGALSATGEDQFLLNVTGRDVRAGKNSTVFNTGMGGSFTGGEDVTYLGSYTGASIDAGAGINHYSGVFEGSQINASKSMGHNVFDGVYASSTIQSGEGDDVFSGYFKGSAVSAGDGENVFSGLFMAGSEAEGGADNDVFSGRFIESRLDGKDGDDRFGNGVDMNANRVSREDEETVYTTITLDADIIGSTIEAGSGNNSLDAVMFNSTVNFAGGDNNVNGVMTGSSITATGGNTNVTTMFASGNTLDITGQSAFIAMGSAGDNAITAHTDSTRIEMGYNKNGNTTMNSVFTPSAGVKDFLWEVDTLGPGAGTTTSTRVRENFGEVHGNKVDVSRGSATVIVNNGEGTQQVDAFDVHTSLQRQNLTVTDQVDSGNNPEDAENADLQQKISGVLQGVFTAVQDLSAKDDDDEGSSLGRYMSIRGDAPLMEGYLAAEITTGVGAVTNLLGESDSNAAVLRRRVGFRNPTEKAKQAYLLGSKG